MFRRRRDVRHWRARFSPLVWASRACGCNTGHLAGNPPESYAAAGRCTSFGTRCNKSVRWLSPLVTGTHRSHSYLSVLMTRSVTAMDPCFPMAPKRGFTFNWLTSAAKTAPTNTLARSEMMCFGFPCACVAHSKALMIHAALGPSKGAVHTTLREKWSIATKTWTGHKPQHETVVVSIDHT